MQISRLSYTDAQGKIVLGGSIAGEDAKQLAQSLDEDAVAVNSIFVQTTGGGIRRLYHFHFISAGSVDDHCHSDRHCKCHLSQRIRKEIKIQHAAAQRHRNLDRCAKHRFRSDGVSVLFPVTQLFGATTTSILLGGLTMSIILLPTIIRSTEEALLVVPQHLRDASLSVGANQSQTIFKIVLPCAVPVS